MSEREFAFDIGDRVQFRSRDGAEQRWARVYVVNMRDREKFGNLYWLDGLRGGVPEFKLEKVEGEGR